MRGRWARAAVWAVAGLLASLCLAASCHVPAQVDAGTPPGIEAFLPGRPVYAFAGQSNSVGNYAPQRATWPQIQLSAHVNTYTYVGRMETVPTTVPQASRKGGAEVRVAERLEAAGFVSARIVKVAFGGTHMQAQWNRNGVWPADGSNGPDENLQEALFSRLDREVGIGGRLAGFAWVQGFSDAQDPTRAAAYADNLAHLLDTVSARYGHEVSILVVPLNSRWRSGNPGALLGLAEFDTVSAAQSSVCNARPNCTLVNPDGWELADGISGRPTDPPHYYSTGLDAMGDAFADAWGIP